MIRDTRDTLFWSSPDNSRATYFVVLIMRRFLLVLDRMHRISFGGIIHIRQRIGPLLVGNY